MRPYKFVEKTIENFTYSIYGKPYLTLFFIIIPTAFLIFQLSNITIDTSVIGMLHENSSERIDYERFQAEFGQDEMVIIGIESKAVLSLNFLKNLKSFHDDIETTVPFVSKITSLINIRDILGIGDELLVADLFETLPEDDRGLGSMKNRIIHKEFYQNTVLSEDETFTAIIIEPQLGSSDSSDVEGSTIDDFDDNPSGKELLGRNVKEDTLSTRNRSIMIKTIYDVAGKHQKADFKISIAGTPVLTDNLNSSVRKDMTKFIGLTFIVVVLFLMAIFRRISGMVIPLIIVIISLLATIGVMAATGGVLKMPTSILPSFLLAVGVSDSVHVMSLFYYHYNRTGDKRMSIAAAFEHTGFAILITSLTTAGGLLALSTSKIAPVADLGIYGSIGVMLALFYTIVLLPIIIALFPIKRHSFGIQSENKSWLDRMLSRLASISIYHPKTVLLISALIVTLAVSVYPRLGLSYNSIKWFPEDDAFRISVETINEKLNGSLFQEAIVDFKIKDSLYDPSILMRIDRAIDHLETLRAGEAYIGKIISLPVFIKEIHQALNNNDESFYKIPPSKNLIAQEFVLFDNSRPDDIYDYTDRKLSKARISIKLPYIDAITQVKLLKEVKDYLHDQFPEASVTLTGLSTIYCSMIAKTATSMAWSYMIAYLVIGILMIIILGRLNLGLLAMIPNVIPIIIMLGVMVALDIPIDPYTMLVGSIAMGISVDDTIHFMHHYRKQYERNKDAESAIRITLITSGRAILITSFVLASAFFIFMFARMSNVADFGFLTGLTIILALIADLMICPSLLILIHEKRESRSPSLLFGKEKKHEH